MALRVGHRLVFIFEKNLDFEGLGFKVGCCNNDFFLNTQHVPDQESLCGRERESF
jgi:hypothetical protein